VLNAYTPPVIDATNMHATSDLHHARGAGTG
jgi:hypothetical protein